MKDRVKLACAALSLAALVAGCSGGGEKKPEASTPATEGTTPAPAAGGQAATLSGTIKLEGAAPARAVIKMAADAVCMKKHAGEKVMSQDVVVDDTGNLKNVFVYVKTGLEGQTFPTPADTVVFDQNGCMYSPHVFGIMVNQPFQIRNSDPTLHNIHALSKNSPEFNLAMPREGMKIPKMFTAPEVMVHIKCDVHPWMSAYGGVLPHPFFAVTDDHGKFEIKNLPAGTYTIEAWQEKLGPQTQTVTVGTTPTQELNFTFKAVGS